MKKNILILLLASLFLIAGCTNKEEKLIDYITTIKEQSDAIKTSLENEALTQLDMNVKSQELYELWDDTLDHLLSELESSLSKEDFEKLLDEQHLWLIEKEKMIQKVGKEVEGGSIYSLVVNSEAAKITEERVYELYEMLEIQ